VAAAGLDPPFPSLPPRSSFLPASGRDRSPANEPASQPARANSEGRCSLENQSRRPVKSYVNPPGRTMAWPGRVMTLVRCLLLLLLLLLLLSSCPALSCPGRKQTRRHVRSVRASTACHACRTHICVLCVCVCVCVYVGVRWPRGRSQL